MIPIHNDFFINKLNAELIFSKLNTYGLAIFSGVENHNELIALGNQLGILLKQDDTDARGIKFVDPSAATRGSYFHTDRASMEKPPNLIVVWCHQQAERGGESIFCDGKQLFHELAKYSPEAFKAFCQPNSIGFGQDKYFGTDALFNENLDGTFYIKFRYDALGYFSAPLIKYVPDLLNLIEKHSFSCQLQDKQGYILQNGRWLHGAKPTLHGERFIYRLILNSDSTLLQDPKFGFVP